MNKLVFFYRLCIFFNLLSSVYFAVICEYNTLDQYINNSLMGIFIINFMKIINQNLIVKYLTLNMINIYKKLSIFDIISDILKFLFCNYIIGSQKKVCVNFSMCVALVIIYINSIVIICNMFYRCCNSIRNYQMQNDNMFYLEHNENILIYTPPLQIQQNYNITNYVVKEKDNNSVCSICLEEQKINEEWSELSCKHNFHYRCIINWVPVNNICPICRCSIDHTINV